MNCLGCAVHKSLNGPHIGLPRAVGSSVGVGDLDAEGHALAADIALCHSYYLLK